MTNSFTTASRGSNASNIKKQLPTLQCALKPKLTGCLYTSLVSLPEVMRLSLPKEKLAQATICTKKMSVKKSCEADLHRWVGVEQKRDYTIAYHMHHLFTYTIAYKRLYEFLIKFVLMLLNFKFISIIILKYLQCKQKRVSHLYVFRLGRKHGKLRMRLFLFNYSLNCLISYYFSCWSAFTLWSI